MKLFRKANEANDEKSEQEMKRIGKVLNDVIELLKFLEKGDFTARPKFPEAFSGDQKPIMNHALGMISNLTSLIQKIKYGFSNIKLEMEQIGRVTDELAGSTEECFAEISLLDKNAQKITKGIEETAQKAQKIANTCETVGQKVEMVTFDIKEFERQINTINLSTIALKNVLSSITGISKEIKMLSLNARIEAVRAGEFGSSFMVIAKDLARLNEKTAEEANRSAEIVSTIIEPINQAQENIGRIVGQSIEITKDAESIVGETAKIAQTTHSQATVAEQISTNIDSLVELIKNNATVSEQSASSTQEVLTHISELSKMLEGFKIK